MLHQDFKDLLAAFARASARYLLVGGYAVAFHSRPRFTKDIDIWVDADPANVERVARALEDFGAPPAVVSAARTARADEIVYFGHPPVRVDLLRELPGLRFDDAWPRHVDDVWDGVPVSVIGFDDLLAAKRAAGRAQDLVDVQTLEQDRRPR